jgi:Uncharacterised protein conserved in bacteria (DUF2336)
MLSALDALIQNGTGGRRALALRQFCELFLKISSTSEESTTTLFDEVMANIAADLDDESVVYLAPEMQQMSAILPAFASTVSSKGYEIALRLKLGDLQSAAPSIDEPALWERGPIIMLPPDAHPLVTSKEHVPSASEHSTSVVAPAEEERFVQERVTVAEPVVVAQAMAPITPVRTEPLAEPRHGPAVGGITASFKAPQASPITQRKPTERRAEPREPAADANNPITLARKASISELLQISVLPNLPESLTNVLVARGDRDVLEKVLQNKTAAFSRSSLTTLAELAPSDRMIKECLIARHDLPEPIIERLLPFLAPLAKAQLLYSDSPFGEQEARKALNQAGTDLVAAYRNGQMLMGVDTCLATVDDRKMTVSEVVILLARDIRVAELSAFMAESLGIRHVTAFNILSSRLDHTAAVLARALGCDMDAIEAVMTMRGRCGCREVRETKSACFIANRYTLDDAKAIVGQFDQIARTANEAAATLADAESADTIQATETKEAMLFAA